MAASVPTGIRNPGRTYLRTLSDTPADGQTSQRERGSSFVAFDRDKDETAIIV
jgi:hypothetical protein